MRSSSRGSTSLSRNTQGHQKLSCGRGPPRMVYPATSACNRGSVRRRRPSSPRRVGIMGVHPGRRGDNRGPEAWCVGEIGLVAARFGGHSPRSTQRSPPDSTSHHPIRRCPQHAHRGCHRGSSILGWSPHGSNCAFDADALLRILLDFALREGPAFAMLGADIIELLPRTSAYPPQVRHRGCREHRASHRQAILREGGR
jgi:hypothetical protein